MKCRKCSAGLVIGQNFKKYMLDNGDYLCNDCKNKAAEQKRRARGIPSRSELVGHGKYGIPSLLPDGSKNPEYQKVRYYALGGKPRKPAGSGKYGIPARLSDGEYNREYGIRWSRAHGVLPKSHKYTSAPAYLKDGKNNPEYTMARNEKIKLSVLRHYSDNESPRCADPYHFHPEPFMIIEALHLDHTQNNGGEERRRLFGRNLGGGGSAFYNWIVKNHFPEGYQVLCANCDWLKEYFRVASDSEAWVNWSSKVRNLALSHYSSNNISCADPYNIHKMPFTDGRCLTFDHILGGGTKHRKKEGYHWLCIWLYNQFKKSGAWPEGYQVLCHNCQDIKRKRAKEHAVYMGGKNYSP